MDNIRHKALTQAAKYIKEMKYDLHKHRLSISIVNSIITINENIFSFAERPLRALAGPPQM